MGPAYSNKVQGGRAFLLCWWGPIAQAALMRWTLAALASLSFLVRPRVDICFAQLFSPCNYEKRFVRGIQVRGLAQPNYGLILQGNLQAKQKRPLVFAARACLLLPNSPRRCHSACRARRRHRCGLRPRAWAAFREGSQRPLDGIAWARGAPWVEAFSKTRVIG